MAKDELAGQKQKSMLDKLPDIEDSVVEEDKSEGEFSPGHTKSEKSGEVDEEEQERRKALKGFLTELG